MKNLNLSVEVKQSITNIEINLMLDNKVIYLKQLIKKIYNIEVETNEQKTRITDLCTETDHNGSSYKFRLLEECNLIISFAQDVKLTVYFDRTRFEIGTVYKIIQDRVQTIIDKIDEFLKNREIYYIVPVTLK